MKKSYSESIIGFVLLLMLSSYVGQASGSEMTQTTTPTQISWSGSLPYEKAMLRVAHPNGMVTDHTLPNGLVFDLKQMTQGKLLNQGRDAMDVSILEDGVYQFEIRFATKNVTLREVDENFQYEGSYPSLVPPPYSGAFRIVEGYFGITD